MKPIRYILLVMFVASFSACTSGGSSVNFFGGSRPPPTEQSTSLHTELECKFFETLAESLRPTEQGLRPSVLSGCAGEFLSYRLSFGEGVRFSRIASNTTMPSDVINRGPSHRKLFQYLMLRGVPARIAIAVSSSPEFAEVAKLRG